MALRSLGPSELLVAHNFFQFTGSEKQSRNVPPTKKYITWIIRK
jgi:hypothetical protein